MNEPSNLALDPRARDAYGAVFQRRFGVPRAAGHRAR
jgi:hypothetical protein